MPAMYVAVPDEVHREIERIAAEEERTLTNVAVRLIRAGIQSRAKAVEQEEETRG